MSYGTVGGHWASEQGIQSKRLENGVGRDEHLNNVMTELNEIVKNDGVNETLIKIQLLQANGTLKISEAIEFTKHYDSMC